MSRPKRGEGTVGYVLVIALIVLGLIAAAWLLRKRVSSIGRGATSKIGKMAADREQPGKASGPETGRKEAGGTATPEGTTAGSPGATPPANSASDDEKEKGNRIVTSYRETEAPPATREESFSFGGLSAVRWLLIFASVIGTAIALWFVFAGKLKQE